jgi:hypothetical protein
MKLLYLTFYFEPDLGPGAFRNTALVNELCRQLPEGSHIHVITTLPNRYQSYQPLAPDCEERLNGHCRVTLERVAVPTHASGQLDQIQAFISYFRAVHQLTKNKEYDLVFASSSRLFTAFLSAKLARSRQIPLFLDIRDLFREAILDVHKKRWNLWLAVRAVLNPVLRTVEHYTFRSANHINLVSEGFRSYFNAYSQATYSYFTNGIDDGFLDVPATVEGPLKKSAMAAIYSGKQESITLDSELERDSALGTIKTILYAGNIGDGQGLHKIIPQAARQLLVRVEPGISLKRPFGPRK